MDLQKHFIDNKALTTEKIKNSIFHARRQVGSALGTMNDIVRFYDEMPALETASKKELKQFQKNNLSEITLNLSAFSDIGNQDLPLFHRAAIGLNYLASNYGYNENQALGHQFSDDEFRYAEFNSYGVTYVDGFKKSCADILEACALKAVLVEDKRLEAEIRRDMEKITFDKGQAKEHPPKWFAHKRVLAEENAVAQANSKLLEQNPNARPYEMRPDWVAKMGECVANVSTMRGVSISRAANFRPGV